MYVCVIIGGMLDDCRQKIIAVAIDNRWIYFLD